MTKQLSCQLTDLFPGSFYRFRIRTACKSGISEPSKATERIFIGRPQEDELFGLPGGNYPKERPSRNLFQFGVKSSKRYSSLGQDLAATNNSFRDQTAEAAEAKLASKQAQKQLGAKKPPDEKTASVDNLEANNNSGTRDRHLSLERDVYYFGNRREEVVNYEKANGNAFGKNLDTLGSKKGLSQQEQAAFKSSLGDLCAKLMTASRSTLAGSEAGSSVKPGRNSSFNRKTGNKPSFQEYGGTGGGMGRNGSAGSLGGYSRSSSSAGSSSSVAAKRGLSLDEQSIYNKSLGDLCGKLMSASRGQLASKKHSRGSADNVSATNSSVVL